MTFALLAVSGWPTVASADDWVEVTSPHFRVITDQADWQARRVALDLERIHALYEQVLPDAVSDPYHRVTAVLLEDAGDLLEWLPRYEDRERPGGLFTTLPSGHYLLIRLDGGGRGTVYHEYLHLLTRMNMGRLPPWLSEGLAEFYSQVDFVGATAKFGRVDRDALRYLNRRSLIPLEELVGRGANPHEDGNYVDVRVFYAQAWALTHYLMLGNEELSAAGVVPRYMERMEQGDDPMEAFVELVGPLDAVREDLRRYLRNLLFRMFEVDLAEEIDDDDFVERDLPEAQAVAERAMVLAGFQSVERAASALAEAHDLAPGAPAVYTAAGFVELARADPVAAEAAFSAAVAAGSESYLPYYISATRRRLGGDPETEPIQERIRRLRRAVMLNPRLVPGYHELAELLAREDRAAESFEVARQAVEVGVREAYSWVLLGRAALRLDEVEAARLAGERGLAAAGDDRSRAQLESFLAEVDRHEAWLAVQEGQRRDRLIREARATGPPPPVGLTRVGAAPSAAPTPVAPAFDGPASPGRQLSLAGTWVELRCTGTREVDFVVRSERPPTTLVLRAPGAGAVEIVDPATLDVQERIECGPVDRQVEVDFTVRRIGGGMVFGDLTELRFP